MTPEDKPVSTANWKHALTEGLDFRKPNEYDAKDRMIIDSEGNCVGIIWEYEGREKTNAELIVRAVNCHERLIEKCEQMKTALMRLESITPEYQIEVNQLLKEAKGE